MHIKHRGTRAMLYRSNWVAKGANGNSHGYSQQTFIGSLPAGAESMLSTLASKLSKTESEFLESKLFKPARLAAPHNQKVLEEREADPIWRLTDATQLVLEAAQKSGSCVVPNSIVTSVQAALSKVRTISQTPTHSLDVASSKSDPLKDALVAIKAARDAVLGRRYGAAPAEGVRSTYPYRLWADIFETVSGSDGNSLMRALQTKGFAKTRAK